ncbi:MAG: tRNA (uridine(34)/cytosine(34)/5-carboxymethylaminomethyluridine(34)-2'-O)-methyltransferase TrmL [Porticoccaceae bacterium]|jgi:tRNA (cytidine/uridine-2'-O-)-methyltransferase|nr:tRNA (uridine(34)/cytosine(34)/5-carboxymethylaminomethyluridine(34)-2'-O)-methyltransferase TrmL [Porticoccaceae bacterium]MEA3300228.1 tRNA (uridine(34)/cytosine(34)/5-carboxymethylaminomethyluridine(34)-2'-O)-methyltransferase TrmL [Pseudomonadota bacterium]HLS99570.1 tRNA (uridine(34)/cytosine(34)/5-carboxymethylaminomethyluridine(34)-2'-O)-methyltransferase TrmL [Porticoccaceae bacterium]
MLHVVLYQPEIPPNTGNIIRLCANTGFALHLVRPLGFEMDDKRLRRAGLDYREWQAVSIHDHWQGFIDAAQPGRVFGLSTRGRRRHTEVGYRPGDALVFGPETRGLPDGMRALIGAENLLRLPMQPESRSLNLSNAAAVVVYEAWRQLDFAGGA